MARNIENSLTSQGATLIARTLAEGKPVVFTRVLLGTGLAPDSADISQYTALIDEYDAADITTKRVNGSGTLVISASYWNTTVQETTYIEEIGVYAKIQGDATDVLFSYLTFGQYPDIILASADASVQRTYDLPYSFGAGAGTSVTITPSGLLPASDAVYEAEAGKLLRMDENGKLPVDITGDAITLGGHGVSYYATADHVHAVATQSANGFESATDKQKLDTLDGRVNQDLKTTASPTFAGMTVNGYIYGARFL